MADACRNCRRPLHWLPPAGWLHGELPQYANQPITCQRPEPVCDGDIPHCEAQHIASGPDGDCPCRCHLPSAERTAR
jgi:hypothetical protein